jgi:glycosyltransferase involved in cell wall biosynthesis
VSYEEAFDAVNNGDFHTAVPLLQKAALETGFASDVINNAYTLSLYKAGDKPRLAEVAFQIASSLAPMDPASAMDYFQRALIAGLNRNCVRQIGEFFETSALPVAEVHLDLPVRRVAHVISCLIPGQVPTEYLKILLASLRLQGIESSVFTTESNASWFCNPARVPQSQSIDLAGDVKIGALGGDFVERADRVCEVLRSSKIQAAFFHGDLSDQIMARIACMRPVPVQINVNYGTEMDVNVFAGRIHLTQNALARTRFGTEPAEWVPVTSDVETRLEMCEPLTRQAMGLESAATISATFGRLERSSDRNYVRVLSEIMKRFPKHFHLFAGPGNIRAMRSQLHAEGVLPRVRFLGDVRDIAPLLNVVDVYLAAFPDSTAQSVLEPMGAAKPVVALRFSSDSLYNCGAELVGLRELIAPGEANYIEIADRLLRNANLRAELGLALRDRFRKEFRPERLGERYKQFLAHFQAMKSH